MFFISLKNKFEKNVSDRWRWVLELSKTPLVGHLEAREKQTASKYILVFQCEKEPVYALLKESSAFRALRRGETTQNQCAVCRQDKKSVDFSQGESFSGTLGPLTRVCLRVDLVFFGPRKGGPPGGLAVSRRTTLGRSASLALFCVQCST